MRTMEAPLLFFCLPAPPRLSFELDFHGISETSVKSQPGLSCCEGSTSAQRHSWHSWGSTGHPSSRISTSLCLSLHLGEWSQMKAMLKEQGVLNTALSSTDWQNWQASAVGHKASTKIAKNKGRTLFKAETTFRRHLLVHGENSNRDRLEMLGHHCWSEDNQKKINRGETFVLESEEAIQNKATRNPWLKQVRYWEASCLWLQCKTGIF